MFRHGWPTIPTLRTRIQAFRFVLACILSFLFVPGLLLLYFTWNGGLRAWDWKETQCFIRAAELRPEQTDDAPRLKLTAEVEYFVPGSSIATAAAQRQDSALPNTFAEDEADFIRALYPAGRTTRCFINPKKPIEFLLGLNPENDRFMLGFGVMIAVLIALAQGTRLGGIQADWGSLLLYGRPSNAVSIAAYSDVVRKRANSLFWVITIAVAALWTILVATLLQRHILPQSRTAGWHKEMCTVAYSKRGESSTDTEAKSQIVYSFADRGREYRYSNYIGLYDDSQVRIPDSIMDIKPGEAVHCYVNPQNPTQAKLQEPEPLNYASTHKLGLLTFCLLLFSFMYRFRVFPGRYPVLAFKDSRDLEGLKLAQWLRRWPHQTAIAETNGRRLSSRAEHMSRIRARAFSYVMGICLSIAAALICYAFPELRMAAGVLLCILIFSSFGMACQQRKHLRALLPRSPHIDAVLTPVNLTIGARGTLSWQAYHCSAPLLPLRFVLLAKERCCALPTDEADRCHSAASPIQKRWFKKETVFTESELLRQEIGISHADSGKFEFAIPKDLPHSFCSPHFYVLWALDVYANSGGKDELLCSFDLTIFPERANDGCKH